MVDSTTTFMVQLENCIVIVKNVPCHKCSQCGEESFSFEVTQRLEKIVDRCKEALTEIAVVNYSAA
ncbi:MAG: type II toxin-antitoxin system MqsA family antitoxin [Ruminiclostridium sp.]